MALPTRFRSQRARASSAISSPRPLDLRISENIEAVAISIAMALVLKFFIIEAYQIPTGSMQPTILGDARSGIKDRVLADKLITMLRPPKRWEVMIFRFPLDERRLYVKRIVGLPGETLEVLGGDIWIDGAIARKPDHVNESVLKHIADSDGPMDVGRWFTAQGSIEVQDHAAIFPNAGSPRLILRRHVVDDYAHGYDPEWGMQPMPSGNYSVPDLDLRLTARLDPGADALRILFESDDGETVFVLPRTGSGETAHALLPTEDAPLRIPIDGERSLPADEELEILARVVDHRLLLEVDGEEWLRYDDPGGPHSARPRRARLSLELQGGGQVSDLSVRRDIFYLPSTETRSSLPRGPGRWEIPDDSYFGMGDNTQYSLDSRAWQTKTYELKDGRSSTGFDFASPGAPDSNPFHLRDGTWRFADVHGDSIVFRPGDVERESVEYAPYIHERYMLGKAGVVFWPIFNPFRWKLIR